MEHSMSGILTIEDIITMERWDRRPQYMTGYEPIPVFGVNQVSIPAFEQSYRPPPRKIEATTRRTCRTSYWW